MIHLERVILPAGLRALAYRDAHGNLVIYVSQTLDAARQRAAVVEAIRASRRAGWRAGAGLPPAGIAVLLGVQTLLRRSVALAKAHPLAWGAAASSAVVGASAAGVFITAVPHHHSPSASPQPSVPSAVQPLTPQDQPPAHTGHQVRARAVDSPAAAGGPGRPASSGSPRPAPTSSGSSAAASPSPAPAPAQPSPSPSPSGGVCVIVLGVRVCVPPVGVSVGT